ncbi:MULTISPECIES: diacylglycerol/lipid kinase family protein [Roseomonadaceae]|uniref:Diacylglycerol kinase n=1 Tax=Falsiroseomonas oleicola TaxID=2801474 RepID=A0ABS6H4K2_9PROT|nr:diacylglycerol kinase family protein [Roseomonas oleicola]MBU8543603.1 diacylglycerol kinase [Roseomonas oleicola]
MRIAVVINAASGTALGREEIEAEVTRHLTAAGLDAVLVPDHAEGLLARLDEAVAMGADAVVVGGGDGSIMAAAERLMGKQTALGILPLGTMNMLAKDLGIPLELEAAAIALSHGHIRVIDVADVNGHVFLCSSVIGSPSWLGRHRERGRGKRGWLPRFRFALAALRSEWRHRPMRLSVALEGGRIVRLWTRALAVANNRYAEGFGLMMARPRLDAGELALYVARRYGAWWWVKLMAGMFLGSWRGSRLVQERTASQVTIGTPRTAIRVMNDGEAMLLTPPLVYRIHPASLRVLVPPPGEAEGAAAETAAAA